VKGDSNKQRRPECAGRRCFASLTTKGQAVLLMRPAPVLSTGPRWTSATAGHMICRPARGAPEHDRASGFGRDVASLCGFGVIHWRIPASLRSPVLGRWARIGRCLLPVHLRIRPSRPFEAHGLGFISPKRPLGGGPSLSVCRTTSRRRWNRGDPSGSRSSASKASSSSSSSLLSSMSLLVSPRSGSRSLWRRIFRDAD
jgi:hypothetical protein